MSKYRRKVPRSCHACQAPRPASYGIPDPCLGTLPGGVQNACCGHGNLTMCYVQFATHDLRGREAREQQIVLGGKPAVFTRAGLETANEAWPLDNEAKL